MRVPAVHSTPIASQLLLALALAGCGPSNDPGDEGGSGASGASASGSSEESGAEAGTEEGSEEGDDPASQVPCPQRPDAEACAGPYRPAQPLDPDLDASCAWIELTPVTRGAGGDCSFGELEGRCLTKSSNLDGCYSFEYTGCPGSDLYVGLLVDEGDFFFEAPSCAGLSGAPTQSCIEGDPDGPPACACACEWAEAVEGG